MSGHKWTQLPRVVVTLSARMPDTVGRMNVWWRWEGWPTAEEWQAVWGLATVAVAAVAAFFALRQLRASLRAGAEQSRPYVTADIVFRGWGVMAIEIKNSGLTAARNIKFDWSERPVAQRGFAQDAINRGLGGDGIPFLAPGRSVIYELGVFDQLPDGAPRRFDVKMQYLGSADSSEWTSESILDIDQWAGTLAEDLDPNKGIIDAIKGLKTRVPRLLPDPKVEAARALKDYFEAQPEVRRQRAKQLSAQRRRQHTHD